MTFSKLKFTLPLLVLLFTPMIASSALVSCDNCTFDEVYPMIQEIVNFVLMLAIPAGAIAIAIGGFYIVVNMGKSGNVEKGKDIIFTAVIGILIAFGGWLIVKTILVTLGDSWVSGIL